MTRRFQLKSRTRNYGIDYEADLNDEQRAVAQAPGGPMLVIAGAGSGKTRALTYRLAWLVEQGLDPARILLVTFTNRAAREMLHRLGTLVHEETPKVWGGTFHHVANRMLRKYGERVGIHQDYTLMDREDAGDLLASCTAALRIPIKERRFPQKRVLAGISSAAHNTLQPVDRVITHRYPMFIRETDRVEQVLTRYAEEKQNRHLLDYDDLLTAWLRLLRACDDLSEHLSKQFLHILVDEYQDTNAIQGALVDHLAAGHGNVCVVGDDAQSIYSFRGADLHNMLHFRERYPEALEFRLETNYRSTPEILALANANITCNRDRLPKQLRATRSSGLRPALTRCHDHFVQARFVAEYILHLLDEGAKLDDIAVLYRSHWHAPELQLELNRRNIPYQVRGGLRFFEQAHIKDVISFLRLEQNPRDELAWLRTLKMLPRVGTRLSLRVWHHLSASEDPFAAAFEPETAALLPGPARPFYQQHTALLKALRAQSLPARKLQLVMDSFYDDYRVSRYDSADLRREDINGMIHFAGQYDTTPAFLADAALAGEFSGETIVEGPEEDHYVTLSTVHQAKGLEWSIVLIPWLADGRFPTDFALNTREDEEEERRVFHVAITRAKDELYLVVPLVFSHPAKGPVVMKPSRFITELAPDLVETMELEEGTPLTSAEQETS